MEEKKDILDYIQVNKIETPEPQFFDNLAQKIIAEEQPIVQFPFYKQPLFWSVIAAASVALIIVITPISSPKKTFVADLSVEEITLYIEENMDDFNTETIEDFIVLETINEASDETNSVQEQLNDLNENEILEYIDSENIWNEFDDDLFI